MKKILSAFIICFLIFWAGRIISINQNPPITAYYDIGDTLDCGDLEVSFIESHLDSPEQFKERFDVESDNSDGEHKVISICISATNKSDKEADLDEIFDFLECGFEAPMWASAINPEATYQINNFGEEKLAPGETRKIWYVTEIPKKLYRESAWKNIDENQFCYVLTLSPQKIAVRLKV